MIRDHEEGRIIFNNLKQKYGCEIELICLNSGFLDSKILKRELDKAKDLYEKFPDRVLIKESEFHTKEDPYYEVSFFCSKEEVNDWKRTLNDMGFMIDLIHEDYH